MQRVLPPPVCTGKGTRPTSTTVATGRRGRGGGKKRRRPTESVLQLPSYLEETLAGVQSDTERAAIAAVLLWVLNRDESSLV